jgi:[FeFe] hydrogenase H-cluster maturation GTPase HydF
MSKGRERKPHIGIFGRRNNGKSSLINVLANQDIAIVSDVAGTTTDPVKKSIEIQTIGPAIIVDTAGIDDIGELGEKRIKKSISVIKIIDLAILVITNNNMGSFEEQLIEQFNEYAVPFLIIHNKSDIEELKRDVKDEITERFKVQVIDFSSHFPENKDYLIDIIKKIMPETAYKAKTLVGDILSYGDIVLLIVPIDIEAPEGRLILPQVQAIRDILDNDAVAIVVKEREVDSFLKKTGIRPNLAITDSSIFLKADASIPKDVPLTGFSILLAKYKGDFEHYLNGTPHISKLKDGDTVLLLESCTHHVSCDDIGRVKIPRWITNFTGKKLHYEVVSGLSNLPRDIREYALVIQCGGCVLTRKQIVNRLKPAIDAGVPVTNYGMAIAYVQGIYERAIRPFTRVAESAADYL